MNKKVAINILNILLNTAICGISLWLSLCGLSYKSLQFIADYYTLLLVLLIVMFAVFAILYLVFYLLNKQIIFRLILCVDICLLIAAVIFFSLCCSGFLPVMTSVQALRDFIKQTGSIAVLLYILFSFLQVVVLPVPGSVSVAVGVLLFGPLKCTLYSFIGIFIGSIVAFAIGKWVGYKTVCWIVGKEDLDKWLERIKGKDYLLLSIMFLLPMFPDDVLCFVAGLSSMTWPYFIIVIAITRIISCFTTAYSFELIPFNTWWGILIWICIIALVVLAFYLVYKYSDKIDKFIKTKFNFKKE